MTLKECILDNRNCENIIIKPDKIVSIVYFKKDGKELIDINMLLDVKVKTSERIGNDIITIICY